MRSFDQMAVSDGPSMSWYFVLPGFRQIGVQQILSGFLLFLFLLLVVLLIDSHLILSSPWAMFIVPLDAMFVAWLTIAVQPHRQIFYRVDAEGALCEYRSSAAPLVRATDLLIGLVCSLFKKNIGHYFNLHTSRSRMFTWPEVLSFEVGVAKNRITLKAGLRGEMVLWVNSSEYPEVLTIVTDYTEKTRAEYHD